jgi:hypothetical protein
MSRERFPQTVPQAAESAFLREAHWEHVAFEFGEHALSQFFHHREIAEQLWMEYYVA